MSSITATPSSPLEDLWRILLSNVDASVEPGHATERGAEQTTMRSTGRVHVEGNAIVIPPHLSASQAHIIVKSGVSSRSLVPLADHLGISKGALAMVLGLERATANRKVAKDEMLPPHAIDSMLRLLGLDSLAREVFETPEEAREWLRQPHPMLDGEAPMDCAKSSFGAERVRDILNAVKYGGVV